MHREMVPLGWLVRISVVALLAVAAGLLSMADPPGASASHDRLQLESINFNDRLEEGISYLGFTLYFSNPVTNLDQITVKYRVELLDGASEADFDFDVPLTEQVVQTAPGRLIIGKYRRSYSADIPLLDDTLADAGERVRITLDEVGITELGDSTADHETGTYVTYDLDDVHYYTHGTHREGRTWTVPIVDNDTLPKAPSNLQGEVWGTDRVHLKWRPGEDGGTVNGEEQPLRYQFRVDQIGKAQVQLKSFEPSPGGWVDMEGDDITSFTIQDPAINLGLATYEFWVRAATDAGPSEQTGPVTPGPQDFAPAPPGNLTATVTAPNGVRLDWEPSAHGGYIDGIEQPLRYQYRIENIPTGWRDIPGEGVTSYTVGHVNLCCNDYTFQIRAFNDHGHSWTSGDVVPVGRVPTPPSNLTATAAGGDSVELRWERSESGGNAPGSRDELSVRYQYRIENLGTGWRDIPGGDVTSHTVRGLDLANNTYTFQVRAANDVGPSWTSGDIPSVGMVDLVGPSITAISLTSNPDDGVLDTGEPVKVTVTFDEAVFLVGKPRFALDVGGAERLADLDSHAGNAVHFEYTVAEGDADEDGIAIPANPFRPDPGTTIKDAAGNDADLDHAAVGPDSNHKVNLAQKATAPTIASVAIGSDPGGDGVYGEGDEIRVGVAFAPPGRITVAGSPQLTLDIGGKARIADYKTASYDGVTILVFAYTVQAGDGDDDGVSIPANAIDLNGGTITGADHDANLTHAAVPADAGHRVDTPPSIRYVILINITEQGRIYTEGERIELEVAFTEAVTVTGAPQLVLDIGGQTSHAELQRVEGASLFFAYTVARGDQDHDGIFIPGDVINLNGGAITDAGGNAAILKHEEYREGAQWVQFLVDAAPPQLVDVVAPAGGDRVVVTFSEELFPAPLLLRAAQAVGVNPGVFYRALFNVYVDGFEVVPSHASIAGNDLVLGVEHPFGDLSEVRVSYNNLFARAAPGILVDRGFNQLRTFDEQTATNNSQFTPEPSDEENLHPVGLRLSPAEITLVEGGTARYTVALADPPPEGEEVRVTISSVPEGLLDVSPGQALVFTGDNWDQPQTVEIGSLADNDDFDNWAAIVHVPEGGGVPYPAYVRVVIEERDQ